MARLDGQVREVIATAWNSDRGGEGRMAPSEAGHLRAQSLLTCREDRSPEARYEPLDSEAFSLATKG